MKIRRAGALVAATLTLAGCSAQAAAPATVTATATKMIPTTVVTTLLATVTERSQVVISHVEETTVVSEVTVTATVTQKVGADGSPAKSVTDGSYLIGSEIEPGSYKCTGNPSEEPYWVVKTKSNEIVENDFSTVASVLDSGYTVQLARCGGDWVKVG